MKANVGNREDSTCGLSNALTVSGDPSYWPLHFVSKGGPVSRSVWLDSAHMSYSLLGGVSEGCSCFRGI